MYYQISLLIFQRIPDMGKFHKEVIRIVGNAVAWQMDEIATLEIIGIAVEYRI
jgi:glycosyltransferase A (GT-A) superfamily protein (DUF2064 family)